jgi:hypothetical protein
VKTLKQKRRSLNVDKEKAKNVKKPVETKTKTPSDSDEMQEYVISNEDQKRIFDKFGGGVLEGSELEARNKALKDAAARY